MLVACRALANTEFFIGDLWPPAATPSRRSPSTSRAATAVWRALYSADPYVLCGYFLAHSLLRLGYPEQGRGTPGRRWPGRASWPCGHARECRAPRLPVPPARSRPARGARAERALITFATEHSLPFWQALGGIFHGWASAESGRLEAGIAELQRGLAAYRATSGRLYLPYALVLLADLHRQAGERAAGLAALAEAHRVIGDDRSSRLRGARASDRRPAAAGRARARAGRRRALLPPRR